MSQEERDMVNKAGAYSGVDDETCTPEEALIRDLADALERRLDAEVGESFWPSLVRLEKESDIQSEHEDHYTDRLTSDIKSVCCAFRQLLRERDEAMARTEFLGRRVKELEGHIGYEVKP